MSTAEKDRRANLLESAGGGRCTMLETASTVMRRRIGRSAIRNGRDRVARDQRGQDQRGITLQALIITSVLVVLAIAVSFTLFAINAGSSEDLEDAGKSGAEGVSCRPNEIFDQDYKSKGLGGPQRGGGVESSRIGCRPHCATWEFMTAGPNDDSEYELSKDWLRITQANVGGPEGNEGVDSSRTGCFAPCYWEYGSVPNYPKYSEVDDADSRLIYSSDNRPPGAGEVRLGVVYARGGSLARWYDTDIILPTVSGYGHDGKPTFHLRSNLAGANAGTRLNTAQRGVLPAATPPNWWTSSADRSHRTWDDEAWEVRADPESKTCEIIDTARNDELVCTSARDNCAPA